jgi:hypothetical protein
MIWARGPPYNIFFGLDSEILSECALTVTIEFLWLGTKRTERLAKARPPPVSKPRQINSMFTANAPILYMYSYNSLNELRRAEGAAKVFGVFRVKNHDFTPKKSYFFQF